MTACVIVHCRRNGSVGSSPIDVTPLVKLMKEAEQLIETCGRRGRFRRVVKAQDGIQKIAEMHTSIGNLTADMGLADIVSVMQKVDELRKLVAVN